MNRNNKASSSATTNGGTTNGGGLLERLRARRRSASRDSDSAASGRRPLPPPPPPKPRPRDGTTSASPMEYTSFRHQHHRRLDREEETTVVEETRTTKPVTVTDEYCPMPGRRGRLLMDSSAAEVGFGGEHQHREPAVVRNGGQNRPTAASNEDEEWIRRCKSLSTRMDPSSFAELDSLLASFNSSTTNGPPVVRFARNPPQFRREEEEALRESSSIHRSGSFQHQNPPLGSSGVQPACDRPSEDEIQVQSAIGALLEATGAPAAVAMPSMLESAVERAIGGVQPPRQQLGSQQQRDFDGPTANTSDAGGAPPSQSNLAGGARTVPITVFGQQPAHQPPQNNDDEHRTESMETARHRSTLSPPSFSTVPSGSGGLPPTQQSSTYSERIANEEVQRVMSSTSTSTTTTKTTAPISSSAKDGLNNLNNTSQRPERFVEEGSSRIPPSEPVAQKLEQQASSHHASAMPVSSMSKSESRFHARSEESTSVSESMSKSLTISAPTPGAIASQKQTNGEIDFCV